MAVADSVGKLSRVKTVLGMLLVGFLANAGIAQAACAPGAPVPYDDIDRILLIRCQVVTGSYPCFRSLLRLQNGQIKSGDLNAIKGVGLKGKYAFSSARPDVGHQLTYLLSAHAFLSMIVPSTGRYIDGEFNLLAVRRCGIITAISNDGDIDDAAHIPWSLLLQRLQASILSLNWAQTSADPDYKDKANWHKEGAIPDMLQP